MPDPISNAMIIHITLYSTFRELLPKEARGRADIELPEDATLVHLRGQLGLPGTAICAINGQIEQNLEHPLKEGDRIQVFRAAGGG